MPENKQNIKDNFEKQKRYMAYGIQRYDERESGVVIERTYPGADCHEHIADDLGVIDHDGLHCCIQHANLEGPLFLLVFQGVLE